MAAGSPDAPLRDLRLRSVVSGVTLLPGGAGVEVEVEGQVSKDVSQVLNKVPCMLRICGGDMYACAGR